jgi:hypothetical protein
MSAFGPHRSDDIQWPINETAPRCATQYTLLALSTQWTMTFSRESCPQADWKCEGTVPFRGVLTRCGLYSNWCLWGDLRVLTLRIGPWGQRKRNYDSARSFDSNLLPFEYVIYFDLIYPDLCNGSLFDRRLSSYCASMFVIYSLPLVRRLDTIYISTVQPSFLYAHGTRDDAIEISRNGTRNDTE